MRKSKAHVEQQCKYLTFVTHCAAEFVIMYWTLCGGKISCAASVSVICYFGLCHAVYTADVLFISLHVCQLTLVFELSVRGNAKEISRPVVYT
jgi:hypothetical protein